MSHLRPPLQWELPFGPDGRARSMLTLLGRGLILVGLLFLAVLVLLLIALSNRGE